MEENGKKVCVTGASGFIASWLVKLLLQRGYTVHATVRDPYDPTKTKHLMAMEGAKERLHVFKAELMEQGSFDAAIAGCDGVFHVASPVIFNPKDSQADVLDPAVKGTHNVLTSYKKFSCIRRVILTSSMATMINNERSTSLAPDVVVDETWFSDPKFCKMPYVLSKVIAEEAALKFGKENKMDMVIMNPGLVIGPMLQPTLNESVATIWNLINGGSESCPNLHSPWVNVKDVAEAHIRAFEIPSAKGRYILADRVIHISQVLSLLHKLYPSLKLPHKYVNTDSFVKSCYQVSQTKAKDLGIEYTPFEVTLKETVESLKELKAKKLF